MIYEPQNTRTAARLEFFWNLVELLFTHSKFLTSLCNYYPGNIAFENKEHALILVRFFLPPRASLRTGLFLCKPSTFPVSELPQLPTGQCNFAPSKISHLPAEV